MLKVQSKGLRILKVQKCAFLVVYKLFVQKRNSESDNVNLYKRFWFSMVLVNNKIK